MTAKTLLIAGLDRFYRIVHPARLKPIVWRLYFWPFTLVIDRSWMAVLLATGYRNEAMEWGKQILHETRSLGPLVQYLETLLLSSRLDEFEEVLEQAVPSIYARRTGEKMANDLVQRVSALRIAHSLLKGADVDQSLPIIENNELLANFFYKVLWQDHTMRDQAGASRAATIYLAAANYPLDSFAQIWNFLWSEYGDTEKALKVIREIESDLNYQIVDLKSRLHISPENIRQIFEEGDAAHIGRKIPDDLMSSIQEYFSTEKILNRIKFEIYMNSEMKEELNELVSSGKVKLESVDLLIKYNAINEIETASQSYIEHAARTRHFGSDYDTPDVALGQLAERLEVEENVDLALQYYRRATEQRDDSSLLTSAEYPWRYATGLMAVRHWEEATYVMNRAQRYMWASMHSLTKVSSKKRLRRDFEVDSKGALFLAGWGIGDETLRLSILNSIKQPGAKYGYVVDSRIKPLLQKSNPDIEFFSNSKVVGPHAVSKEQYWLDREGVLPQFGHARVTTEIMDRRYDFADLAQSEDLFYHFVKNGRTYKATTEPLLKPDSEVIAKAREWLASLPGRVKVGISWRGGERSFVRDKSYTDIMEWGEIFDIKDVSFVNLQYSDTSIEVQEVREKFDVEIYSQPGVDLKNDIEEVCALCCAVDLVISPCSAVLEFAGASGANTISVATTPYLPDLWRVDPEDEITDRFYPSVRHVTYYKHGSRQAVLREIANQVSALKEVDHVPD